MSDIGCPVNNQLGIDRRSILETLVSAGAVSLAGCSAVQRRATEESNTPLELENTSKLPPLFDCNVWIGETDVDPISARLYRSPSGSDDSPEAILAEMDRVGIDRALVYHITARTEDAKAGNERVLDDVSDISRMEPSWVVTPEAIDEYGGASAFVDAMQSADITAVRTFPGEHEYRLTNDTLGRVFSELAEDGGVLVLDALSGIAQDGFDFADLQKVCSQYETATADQAGLRVLLTNVHPSMGPSPDRDLIATVNAVDNLHVGTSRLQSHKGLRQFVDRCGIEKLVFGTHHPHASVGAGLANLMFSFLSPEERRQVADKNIDRVLGETTATPESDTAESHLQSTPYGIVDIHGHVRRYEPNYAAWPDADGIVEQMDRTGIDVCCISNTGWSDTPNAVVADAVERHPDRLVPIAYASPYMDDLRGELERCFDELGMRIIKIHPSSDNTTADDSAYDVVYEFADEREALVVTHAYGNEETIQTYENIVSRHPNLTFMPYHAGRQWPEAENFARLAKEYDNVLLEITYSYNIDGIIEYLIDQAGPEKVFFGTDLGTRAPSSQVGWATYARLDEEDRHLHLRENALQLLDDLGALPDGYQEEL